MLKFLEHILELIIFFLALLFENIGKILFIVCLVAVLSGVYSVLNKKDGFCGTDAGLADPNCAEVLKIKEN